MLAASTEGARRVPEVMADFVDWVRGLGRTASSWRRRSASTGPTSTAYLRRFTAYGLAQGPDETDRLFHGAGLCLKSLACGVVGGDPATFSVHDLPSEWFGEVEHTHRAIDDARGYANLLVEVLRRSRERVDPAL